MSREGISLDVDAVADLLHVDHDQAAFMIEDFEIFLLGAVLLGAGAVGRNKTVRNFGLGGMLLGAGSFLINYLR